MPFDGKNVSEIARSLIEAKDYIQRNGWCQGDFSVGDSVCAVGALNAIGDYSDETIDALAMAIGGCNIPLWNDVPERTLDDVLAAYDRAIANEIVKET
jgi:hypothetical protein